jgi:GntR family transcriptional repressor for pyruvate dehydrogenase complex
MSDLFTPHSKESAVDIVVNSIKNLLLCKKLRPGDKLPNELDISKGLGVSRGSVREAMKILSAFGIVEVKVGDGTYVTTSLREGIINPFLFTFLLSEPDIRQLSEFRRYLEMDVVQLIINHSGENADIIARMDENIAELTLMMEHGAPHHISVKNDMDFHRLMAKASCNIVMEKIYSFVLDYLENTIAFTHTLPNNIRSVYHLHTSIFSAIKAKNSSLARDAINSSVDVWETHQEKPQG